MGKSIFRRLASAKLYLEGEKTQSFRLEVLQVVEDFIKKAEFSNYAKKDLLIKTALWDEEAAAEVLGVGREAVRKYRSRFTADALAILGDKVFDIIMFGSKQDVLEVKAIVSLYSEGYSSSSVFPTELVYMLRDLVLDKNSDYAISDCKPEMTLLHWLSKLKWDTLFNRVDIDRLGFLLDVLDGKRGTPRDRVTLLKVLTCDDPLLHCKSEDKKLYTFPPEREGYV